MTECVMNNADALIICQEQPMECLVMSRLYTVFHKKTTTSINLLHVYLRQIFTDFKSLSLIQF